MRKESYTFLATLVVDGSSRMIGLCIPLLAVRFGASYSDMGALSAVSALVYIIGCLTYRRLADRIGYQRCMAVSTCLIAVLTTLYPWTTRVAHIAALSCGTSLLVSGYWPVSQAWLGRGKSRRDLLPALSHFNLAMALCSMVGPVAGGALYGGHLAWPFLIGAGLIGTVSLSLFALRFQELSLTGTAPVEPGAPVSHGFLRIAWVANFATFFTVSVLRSLFPKLATDLGIAPGTLGRLMALIGLTQLITFYLLSRTGRWQFRLAPLAVAQALGAMGLLTFAAGTSSGVFAAGFLTVGVLMGVTFTASIFYSLSAGGTGSRRAALHEAVVGFGFLLGPPAGGFVAESLSPRAPYLVCAGVILCAVGVQTYLYQRERQSAVRDQRSAPHPDCGRPRGGRSSTSGRQAGSG